MTEPDPTGPPRVLSGRYELSHLIARGGMAEVYLARDRMLDRPVALKILFPELSVDRSFVERFRREAQAAANLSHPNIVPVFDWGEDSGTYFIVMEYVDGRTLSSILRSAGELHPDRAAEVAADVAAALSYAHRHSVVHRDVKPGNVLITEEGVVKVTDFGIARALNTEESLTQTGAVMGTATYFSPEQAEGLGVDARSDIYSLGVVLFEMVTGRPPFLGETPVSVASKHVREHPPTPREINPSVPPDLEAIILKCMAKSPEHRYASGDDLRIDLLRFREGRSVAATVPPATVGTTQAMGPSGRTATLPQIRGPEPLDYDEPEKSRTGLYVALLILLLAALAVVVLFLGNSLGWWHLGKTTKPTFALPNVAGQTVSGATHTLEQKGLNVTLHKDTTSTESTNDVLNTDPTAGTKVRKGQTITLVTGGKPSPKQLKVPGNLIGQSVNAAKDELALMGLQSITQMSAQCTEQNTVCNTSPAGGSQITQGGVVTLFTAQTTTTTTSPSSVSVPNVSGLSVTQACNRIDQAMLTCGSSSQTEFSSFPSGSVSSTSPPSGSSAAPGATVNLILSEGSPPSVPGVVGQTFGVATSQLESDGLKGESDGSCANSNYSVIGQSPGAGSSAPNNGVVILSCTAPSTTTTSTTVAIGPGHGPGNVGGGATGAGATTQPGPPAPRTA